MKEGSLAPQPSFLRNPSGKQVKQLQGGGSVGDTVLPIIKQIKQTWNPAAIDDTIEIQHGLGKICDFFGRIRSNGTWENIPQFETIDRIGTFRGIELRGITKESLTLVASGQAYLNSPYEIELYFIDFAL